MMINFLKTNPHLKPVHIYNLYDRFQKISHGTLHLVYNTLRDTYELHSTKSFMFDGESINAVLEEDMLNGWLVIDFKANDVNKFGMEISGEREFHNKLLEEQDNKGFDLLTTRTLKTIETMVGREI